MTAVSARAQNRIAWRLLPFVFLLYLVNYIDRVNVSFANLRMSADLGFSDRVYGLGVGIFYLTYVLFEIPGALLVERWSARKWIARIMISWGLVTILTGLVQTAGQFYAARFFLGMAESSFFPGIVVYLTHWFPQRERCRSLACLYIAVPAASLIGSPLAGWILGVHWWSMPGWRWLFFLEGIPAIMLGAVTIFYLTDRPAEARWLPNDERDCRISELEAELQAKKKMQEYTVLEALREKRVVLLSIIWCLAATGYLGNVYWLPTFVKRLSGFSDRTVTSLLIIPAAIGIAGMLLNSWHSDERRERRLHAALPLLASATLFAGLIAARHHLPLAISCLLAGSGLVQAFYPVFWSMPTMILSESAAAASFGLINSIGQLGGLTGPFFIGALNDRSHSLLPSFVFIPSVFVLAAGLILSLKLRDPTSGS